MTLRFSICIEMLYPGRSIEERLERVATAGFSAVEFWDWRDKPLDTVVPLCAALGLSVTNMSGHRGGSLLDPHDFETYKDEVVASIAAAQKLSCGNLMLLTNPLGPGGTVLNAYPQIPDRRKRAHCVAALSRLAPLAEEGGMQLLLEPLNTRIDHPGYWLDNAQLAFQVIREVGHPRVRLLYDAYHMHVMGRDTLRDISENLDAIGYVHAADFPGRHEPGTGKMNYSSIFRLLESVEPQITVGFEFSPASSSDRALHSVRGLIEPFLSTKE
ncbi:MAG: TIM barrel protein [Candidatus Abyssubacteria bacterium]